MGLRGPARRPHGRHRPLFGPVRSGRARPRTLLDATTGRRALYGLPMGRATNHVHVWKSLLEQAGFTLADIPKEWEAFWSFWCDQVQPAVRKARAATTSGASACRCRPSGRHRERVLPVRGRLRGRLRDPRRPAGDRRSGDPAQAHQGDRQLHGDLPQGLHPARFGRRGTTAATTRRSWRRAVVMTLNETLSIPNALKADAARRLLQERRDHRLARRRLRPAASPS